ncbi:RHS repeat-associated core domain-containing protein [Pseudomonas putida]|uniref:RHS repeat-associated core domain-containing protein n=1 Tax=Pseudomonas putida TaxID=303 RepID=UPI0018D96C8A|nr:RHS repeat-associated core domain-containing protein [Pseudomonas putida]
MNSRNLSCRASPLQARSLRYTCYGYNPVNGGQPSYLRFNGERTETWANGYLLGQGYRLYSAELMRFNSPDSVSPFGEGGLNVYTYCAGDPVNQTDPTGHMYGRRNSSTPPRLPGTDTPGAQYPTYRFRPKRGTSKSPPHSPGTYSESSSSSRSPSPSPSPQRRSPVAQNASSGPQQPWLVDISRRLSDAETASEASTRASSVGSNLDLFGSSGSSSTSSPLSGRRDPVARQLASGIDATASQLSQMNFGSSDTDRSSTTSETNRIRRS